MGRISCVIQSFQFVAAVVAFGQEFDPETQFGKRLPC
jgi:hypothetical protein